MTKQKRVIIFSTMAVMAVLTAASLFLFSQKWSITEGTGINVAKQAKEDSLASPNDFLAREKISLTEANPVNQAEPENNVKNEDKKGLTKLDCHNQTTTAGQFSCYEKFYQGLVADGDPKAAMVDLKTRYHQEPYVKAECHQLAHVIGRAATVKYPTVDEAYIRGDSACWSGYYHGVIEALMREIGWENITSKTLNDICRDLARREPQSFDHYNCVHGIGHGAMYLNGNELFVALETCDQLESVWEQSSCWGGVFMENIIADNRNHFTNYLKADDPLYPCNAVKDNQKSTCYLMQTSYMLKLKDGDFKEVFALCGTVGEDYTDTCYQSLGRDASGWTISDPERTKNYCLLGPSERAKSNCIIGAVKDFISYHHSDVEAKVFCNALDSNLKSTCLETTEDYYRVFN
jgi:hypothetical protein